MASVIDDPTRFWERRHAALDAWRSGGDRGLTPEENVAFYAWRLGKLIELVRRHAGGEPGLRVLDAGCGRGFFTDGLRRCGYDADGVDSSPTAVARATEAYGPHFAVASLDSLRVRWPYDVVICVDVLFHLVHDDAWRAALGQLARACSAEAALIVTGVLPATRFQLGDYIVHRTLAEHDAALAAHDFARAELAPYDFGSNLNQFAVYVRRP